eukprot:3543216-Amphidinium_carterae.1
MAMHLTTNSVQAGLANVTDARIKLWQYMQLSKAHFVECLILCPVEIGVQCTDLYLVVTVIA